MATSMAFLLFFVLFASVCFGPKRGAGSTSSTSRLDGDAVSPGQVFFVAGCIGGMIGGLLGGVIKNSYHY